MVARERVRPADSFGRRGWTCAGLLAAGVLALFVPPGAAQTAILDVERGERLCLVTAAAEPRAEPATDGHGEAAHEHSPIGVRQSLVLDVAGYQAVGATPFAPGSRMHVRVTRDRDAGCTPRAPEPDAAPEHAAEVHVVGVDVAERTTLTFYEGRIYRLVSIWLSEERPDDLAAYRRALAETVATAGARYLIEGPGAEFASPSDPAPPPDVAWIIEWPDAAAREAYLRSAAFRDNVHLFQSGVRRFEAVELGLRTGLDG